MSSSDSEERSPALAATTTPSEEPTDWAIVESPLSERFKRMVNDSAVAQRVVVWLQQLGIPDMVSIAAMSDDQWLAVLAFLPVKRPGRAEDLADPERLGPGHESALGRLRLAACEEHPSVVPAPPLAVVVAAPATAATAAMPAQDAQCTASTQDGATAAASGEVSAAYAASSSTDPEPTQVDLWQLLQAVEDEADIAMHDALVAFQDDAAPLDADALVAFLDILHNLVTASLRLSSPRHSTRTAASLLESVTDAVEFVHAAQRLGLVTRSRQKLVEVAERRVRDVLVWCCQRHAKTGARPQFMDELERCYGGMVPPKETDKLMHAHRQAVSVKVPGNFLSNSQRDAKKRGGPRPRKPDREAKQGATKAASAGGASDCLAGRNADLDQRHSFLAELCHWWLVWRQMAHWRPCAIDCQRGRLDVLLHSRSTRAPTTVGHRRPNKRGL